MASSVAMIATFQLTPQMFRLIQVNKLPTQNQLHVKNPKNQMSQIPTQMPRLRVKKTKSEVDPWIESIHKYSENKDLLIHNLNVR